jgi:hypothetical protein
MSAAFPALADAADVVFAATAQGARLPVIDVSLPRFRVADDAEAMSALRQAFVEFDAQQRQLPRFLSGVLMRLVARQSLLVRAMTDPEDDFLDGLSTYVMKLGVDNLVAPFDSRIDRAFAASPPVLSMRLRLQQIAQLMADALEGPLFRAPGTPLHLVNIGGGPAIDSLNALILLRHRGAALLGRRITVQVLDPDDAGPAFGARALAALSAPGAPLAGTDVHFEHVVYRWQNPAPLRRRAARLAARGNLLAASSEGALFEYADDATVVANLAALHAAGPALQCMVGSATRADELTRRLHARSRFTLMPRDSAAVAALVARGGFTLDRVEPALISDQILLRPAVDAD